MSKARGVTSVWVVVYSPYCDDYGGLVQGVFASRALARRWVAMQSPKSRAYEIRKESVVEEVFGTETITYAEIVARGGGRTE